MKVRLFQKILKICNNPEDWCMIALNYGNRHSDHLEILMNEYHNLQVKNYIWLNKMLQLSLHFTQNFARDVLLDCSRIVPWFQTLIQIMENILINGQTL